MLKGRYKAIFFSLVVHSAIFYLISQTVIVPPIAHKIKSQAIKSFLYVPPKQEVKTVKEAVANQTETTKNIETVIKEPAAKTIQEPVQEIADNEQRPISSNEKAPENTTSNEKTISPAQTIQPPKNFSAYGQLKNLKQRLNNKIMSQESLQYGRRKTASILDGEPELVPHSTKQLTKEEIKKNTTKQISSDIKITKGDDGLCTIERDLSVVGMEGVKSVEGFNCGKSKFDKNFQDHMKKVLKKLGK